MLWYFQLASEGGFLLVRLEGYYLLGKKKIFWGICWSRRVRRCAGPLFTLSSALGGCPKWTTSVGSLASGWVSQWPSTLALSMENHIRLTLSLDWKSLFLSKQPPLRDVFYPLPSRFRSGNRSTIPSSGLQHHPYGSLNFTLTYGSGPLTKSPRMSPTFACHLFCLRALTDAVWMQMPDEPLNPGSPTAIRLGARHFMTDTSMSATVKQEKNNTTMKGYLSIRWVSVRKVPRQVLVLWKGLEKSKLSPFHPILPAPTFSLVS